MSVDRSYQNFQQNLKGTSLGVNFGRRLFTNPDSLTGKQITDIMQALGLNIPKEVVMTAQAAQAISTGSTAIENYQTAQNVQSLTSSSAATVKVLNQIGSQNGWIDDETSSAINIATSVAMIYASAGMNVAAWMSLGMEFYSMDAKLSAQAQMLAQKGAIERYKSMISIQSQNLVTSIKYMANGQISPFGFLVKVAESSPALFPVMIQKNENFKFIRDIFPGLEFVPTTTGSTISDVKATNWAGMSQSGKFVFEFETLKAMGREEATNFLFSLLFEPIAKKYLDVEIMLRNEGRMSLPDFLILNSLSSKNYYMSSESYYLVEMLKNRLTTYDFGYSVVGMTGSFTKSTSDIALDFEGKKLSKTEIGVEEVALADRTGHMQIVIKSSYARNEIERFLSLSQIPIDNEVRDIRNFIATLDFLDMAFNSGIREIERSPIVMKYKQLGTIVDFKIKLQNIQTTSMLRKTNALALSNVAYFLGAKNSTQIQNVSGLREDGGASVFRKVG